MKYAIIETGGKQYVIEPGNTFKIEKLGGAHKKGDTITFEKVLLFDDGAQVKIGAPYVEGASVEAVLEEEGKAKKISVIKFKAKTRYRTKRGHRQPYAKVKIS